MRAIFGLAGTGTVTLLFAVSGPSEACSLRAWSGPHVGAPVVGSPTDPQAVPRYTGRCAVSFPVSGTAIRDDSPAGEATLRVRFYVYTGLSTGSAVIYRAVDSNATPRIQVVFNRASSSFDFATTSGSGSISAVVQDRWYSIELNWSRVAATMGVVVRGGAATTDQIATVSGVGAADQIETELVGWVSGAGTVSQRPITVDGYEARASEPIGRLCRGDANNDGVRNSADQIVVRNEFLYGTLGVGQPDANEDGAINSGDQIVVRNLFLGSQGARSSGV